MMQFISYESKDIEPVSSGSIITDVALMSFVLFTMFYIGYVVLSIAGVL
jgi:hypothetical protein